ncbi:hypothetical protein ACIRCZ_18660 [Leifsonia sp. NPDC102414]|uniref:hypothetical protein n=1 Tax=Leifsonia sp. NPDC102414 TaxID=3364124 RepID=UPI003824D49A
MQRTTVRAMVAATEDSPEDAADAASLTPETQMEVTRPAATKPIAVAPASRALVHVPQPAMKSRRVRGRWLIPVSVAVACVLACGVAGVAAAMTGLPDAAVKHAQSSTPRPGAWRTLPGWSTSPAWSSSFHVDEVAVAVDGTGLLARTGTTIRLVNTAGDTVFTRTLAGASGVLAGQVGETPVLVAVGETGLLVWAGKDISPRTVPIDTNAKVIVRGGGVLVTTPTQVSVLTVDGLAPYGSPRPGTVPLAALPDGAMQWASARGAVLTASAAGTLISTTALTPPVEHATVTRWLAGRPTIIVVVWSLPDGTTVLGAHDSSGNLTGTHPLTETSVMAPLVVTADRSTAMIGDTIITLDDGTVSATTDTDFVASTAIGDTFYGATGTTPTLFHTATGTAEKTAATPTITPVGTIAARALVATGAGRVLVFPSTSAPR